MYKRQVHEFHAAILRRDHIGKPQVGGMEFMNGITKIDDFNVAPFIGGLNEVQKVFSNGYTCLLYTSRCV